jgi:hypothetical protein
MKNGLILLMAAVLAGGVARADNLAIIVAKSVPIESVSSQDLAKIFRCEETSGAGGITWEVFSRERMAPERNFVLKAIYQMSEAQYNRFFMQAIFAGKLSEAPRVIPSAKALKAIAASRPGAIAYVLSSEIDDTVKPLKIDGFLPGDPGYPLKWVD